MPKIVDSEAKTVRLIYKLFLDGKTASGIEKHLSDDGILTPSCKGQWQSSTVLSILQNEKYKGEAMLQKTFTVDFLTKKKKVNEGEIPQYYVENGHPALVSPEVFDLAQHELKKRKTAKGYKTGGNFFSGKIICGECGSFFGSKVWHSTSKYRRTIWQCNNKFKNNEMCETPHLYEETLKKAFIDAFNSIIDNKEEIIAGYVAIVETLTDNTALDKKSEEFQRECDVALLMIQKCVEENAHSALDQAEYNKKYLGLTERYRDAQSRISKIDEERLNRTIRREQMVGFLNALNNGNTLLTEFDEELWIATVVVVTVKSEQGITFTFKDGTELPWKI